MVIKLIDFADTGLAEAQTKKLKVTIAENGDILSISAYDIGRCNLYQHSIDTGLSRPIRQQPYRLPHSQREQLRAELDEMLEAGFIAPSNSQWGSPIVYVVKHDGSLRLCTDFRKLNSVAELDIYPLPGIDDILGALRGTKYMSSLDLSKGFWQLELDPATKEKTAFVTVHGQYEYNVRPFGLHSSQEHSKDVWQWY